MLLNHINHKMPIYKDCTLFELLIVSGAYLVLGGLIFSLLTWIFIGYASIGWALTLLSLVHATRFLLGRLQRLKYGKPYGYYQQLFFKKLGTSMLNFFWKTRLVTRIGRWSVRREL
ncbi:MAG TPA: DUF3487 family protein [Gammaproteobacteria bacterium]|nr:DUF3487 family protein [Gammaproteobacteria bacterium]HVY53944.1 DUF3487 family protein [Gammaproteobacteria bacterium]